MALNDTQKEFVEWYCKGETITNISKIIGITRQSIYEWLKKDEIKTEIDKCITEMKTQAEQKLVNDVDKYINEIKRLALTSKSEKVRTENLQYILDRLYGKSTTKVADVTDKEDNKDNVDKEQLNNEFTKFKVINTEDKKKAN